MERLTELSSPLEPKYFYCCESQTDLILRANLLTGEHSIHQLRCYEFKIDCRWSELPGGSLVVTGGFKCEGLQDGVREVVKIDTLRECAVSNQPLMHTARRSHAAMYHCQYLYVLGGYCGSYLRECERYSCAESRWEVLPALPVAGWGMSAVELQNSIYALGGYADGALDTVQKLSLDSLTWELMQLKLPQTAWEFPCFKSDTKVYLVVKETLCSFTGRHVDAIKTLPEGIECMTSYYSRGTLYYDEGVAIKSLAVGELSSL
jgi:hypothetical protein